MFIEVVPVLLVQFHTELVDDRALQFRSLSLCIKDNWVARILLKRVLGRWTSEPHNFRTHHLRGCDYISNLPTGAITMHLISFLPFAAMEYSLIYLLGGGGLVGAVVIFVIAKMLRR